MRDTIQDLLERSLLAIEDEVLSEERETKPIRITMQICLLADLVFIEKLAQVNRLGWFVRVLVVITVRLGLHVFTQFECGRRPTGIGIEPSQWRFRWLGHILEVDVAIEEPLKHLNVVSTLYQSGPKCVSHNFSFTKAHIL